MAPTIGYWPIRALVDPILLCMHQLKQSYRIKHYKFGGPPDHLGNEWPVDKERLGLTYPNIPYLIDGDVKVTQCLAILRYIGRKYNFGPKSEEEIIRSDIFEQGAHEMLYTCFRVWYVDTEEELNKAKPHLHPYLRQRLEQTSTALGSNRFILGDRMTYVDCLLYSVLDYIRLYDEDYLSRNQNLRDFLDRIESLPEIKKYHESKRFSRFPICAPNARWGNNQST
uniref:glutathione transferase n=2 Tax=Panonychus citri TaxID=50023 RepID=H9BTE2_PANCT|nr:glutathione S-transferase mu1 [Panonychus citri]